MRGARRGGRGTTRRGRDGLKVVISECMSLSVPRVSRGFRHPATWFRDIVPKCTPPSYAHRAPNDAQSSAIASPCRILFVGIISDFIAAYFKRCCTSASLRGRCAQVVERHLHGMRNGAPLERAHQPTMRAQASPCVVRSYSTAVPLPSQAERIDCRRDEWTEGARLTNFQLASSDCLQV